jgi:hypothetical protein
MIEIKSSVLSCLKLSVATDDATHEYTLAYPIPAVIQAEKATGKDLKSLTGWFNLETKDMPAVIEAGLVKHHPDLKPGEFQSIVDNLTLESLDEIHYALCKLAFPKTMAEVEARRAQSLPNAPSAVAV